MIKQKVKILVQITALHMYMNTETPFKYLVAKCWSPSNVLLQVVSKWCPWFLPSPGSHPMALHHIQFFPLSNTALLPLLHNYNIHRLKY